MKSVMHIMHHASNHQPIITDLTCCVCHAVLAVEHMLALYKKYMLQAPSERINGGARAWQQHFKIYLEIFM